MRKTTMWGPGLVPATFPHVAATRLHLEEGTEVLLLLIHSPLYASAVDTHPSLHIRDGGPPGQVGREIRARVLGGRLLGAHEVRSSAHAELPRARENGILG